jgi:DNA-binding NarL/FixJ family response regulator
MPTPTSLLTRGEIGVLQMLADGWTDRQIADELAVSKRLVAQYRHQLCAKTGARNRVELTRYAVAAGLVPRAWTPRYQMPPAVAATATF